MNDRALFAFTGTVFAVLFLVSIIVIGGGVSRSAALAAALLAASAQYVGSDAAADRRAYLLSIYLAYGAFALSIGALLAYVGGR